MIIEMMAICPEFIWNIFLFMLGPAKIWKNFSVADEPAGRRVVQIDTSINIPLPLLSIMCGSLNSRGAINGGRSNECRSIMVAPCGKTHYSSQKHTHVRRKWFAF